MSTLPPAFFTSLCHLTCLNLEYNQLGSLPEAIGQFNLLQELWLNDNQFESLPESIGELKALQGLWLNNNRLGSLPASIGELTALRTLWLDDNQLISPPQEVAEQGFEAIRAYFRDLATTGTQLYEAKIVLVGTVGRAVS